MSGAGTMAVGVCTFNRGEKIVATLEAIAAMDRRGGRVTRLVVIDNASTDGTGEVVDAFARSCGRIPIERVVEPRRGLAEARARLARETDEPVLALIDDDVLPDAAWAATLLDAFDGRADAGMAGGKIELVWESGPTPEAVACAAMLARQDFGERARALTSVNECLVGAAFAVRREALEASGWLGSRVLSDRTGEALTSGGDFELNLRVRAAACAGGARWQTVYVPGARAGHVIPASRQTRAYLCRLARGINAAHPHLAALARRLEGSPAEELRAWAQAQRRRAAGKLQRTRWLEWRPWRRALRLAERTGRVEGWAGVLESLGSNGRWSGHEP